MFTLLFLYVFGSAIHIPGMSYQNYLLPGLLGQSLAFGVIGAGSATATDFATGVVDRFRSLPVTRLSVISAQVIGQIIEQILGIVIVVALGIALGWRPDLSVGNGLELVVLILLGLFAFTWFGVLLGMLVRSSDAVQGIGFAIMLPLSFLGGTFVPISGMKLVPRVIGQWEPISTLVAAIRHVSSGHELDGLLAPRAPGHRDGRLVRRDNRDMRAARPAPLQDRQRLTVIRQSGAESRRTRVPLGVGPTSGTGWSGSPGCWPFRGSPSCRRSSTSSSPSSQNGRAVRVKISGSGFAIPSRPETTVPSNESRNANRSRRSGYVSASMLVRA